MNKSNIVLVGLKYDNNLGDQAIFACMKRMLSDCLGQLHADLEIREMDMTGRKGLGYNPVLDELPAPLLRGIVRRSARVLGLKRLTAALVAYECRQAAAIQCRQLCDENTKAILFAGGGIIKYRYQNFHDYIVAVVSYAQQHRIPVMISAAGVEGYDGGDRACRRLKAALNSPYVKCITTRDDIRTLRELYCRGNDRVRTALVADPACSMSLYFPRQRPTGEKVIGLGVVREGLFTDNDIDFGKEKMLRFWSDLYREIEAAGYRCQLFCNGAVSDQRFAQELLEYMGIGDGDGSVLAERPTTAEMLADRIAGYSGVVAGRLHASIIAYAYGVPSVGLVWNEKQVMFGQAIGCEERFFRVEAFEPARIVQGLLAAMAEGYDEAAREAYRRTTAEEIRRFLQTVAEQQGSCDI